MKYNSLRKSGVKLIFSFSINYSFHYTLKFTVDCNSTFITVDGILCFVMKMLAILHQCGLGSDLASALQGKIKERHSIYLTDV